MLIGSKLFSNLSQVKFVTKLHTHGYCMIESRIKLWHKIMKSRMCIDFANSIHNWSVVSTYLLAYVFTLPRNGIVYITITPELTVVLKFYLPF